MKKPVAVLAVTIFLGLLLLQACRRDNTLLTAEAGEEYSGGAATVFDNTRNAFGHEIEGLSGNDGLLFFAGNSFFKQNWVTAPASATARDGLGPLFQARSCSSCHGFDGRGQPPLVPRQESIGLLLRISTAGFNAHGGPAVDPVYGDQLQDNSIQNVDYEGKFDVVYTEVAGTYADGTSYSLRKPTYNITDLKYGPMQATLVSPRIGQQIIGMGLLEAISEADILALEDLGDANGDGITGKANRVWDEKSQTNKMGRLGWKANQPTVLQQVCGALSGDLGLTTHIFPTENCSGIANCETIPNGGTPEVEDEHLNKIVLYTSVLAVPARRDWNDQDVLRGKELFTALNCSGCHTPKFKTGTHAISVLSNNTIRPYTDLLLHDMGDGLADNRPDFLADGKEWRTQPLWGLGLIHTVNGHQFLLHDGRARNIEEAILWHGGEAEKAKTDFKKLSKADRDKLIKFLNSL